MSELNARLGVALADRYQLEREIGAGGMATVYAAADLKHDRRVALKVLRPELGEAVGAERFLHEIRTTANLQHPHIVPVFDSGAVEVGDGSERRTLLYFVMPLIEGESLRDHLDRAGPLSVPQAVSLVREIAGALEYAHARGILHRDLKPENILVSHGHALLADFGIARAQQHAGNERLTQTGLAIGTPAYMSPEQATGERELDATSDVYALASILYELLTGEMPFTGETAQAILVKRFTQEAPRVRARRADTPVEFEAAIARALAREPAQRFATAAAFAAALSAPPERRDGTGGSPRTERSIAVLPFTNLSPDADNAYFADGLTEEVITTLSKVGTLRVIARSTMMQFRDRPAAEVARELGVTHALEGSVRKAGDRLRISASVLTADHGESLWTERFDGVLADVFDMQDRVAEAVVQALDVVLTPEESRRIADRPLDNVAAYDRYLRARQSLNEMSLTGVDRAFGFLEDALAIAPGNVLLLRGLGIACYSAANTTERVDREALLDRALGYADAIERQQPDSPYSAEIRGLVATLRGQPEAGLRQLGRAFELLPEDIDIAFWYGFVLAYTGHGEVARAIGHVSERAAPGHPLLFAIDVFVHQLSGRFAEALERLARAPASAPASAVVLLEGLVHLSAGSPDRARSAFDRSSALEYDVFAAMSRFHATALQGDAAAARAHLTPETVAGIWSDFQYAEWIAQGFAVLGDGEEAARWLERSAALGNGIHAFITEHSAVWRPWLAHPRFVPIIDAFRQNAERYARMPVAPRALALVRHE